MTVKPARSPAPARPASTDTGAARARARDSRRNPLGIAAVGALVAALVLAAVLVQLSGPRAPETAGADDGNRVGSIVIRRGAETCEHRVFDNATGAIIAATGPCNAASDTDGSGAAGTSRRLNAISKSFQGSR